MWDELTLLWNDLTIDWKDLTWNDLTMEQNNRMLSIRDNLVQTDATWQDWDFPKLVDSLR